MRKISGHVVSTKPITLSRAAKLICRFAAVDNGSSPAVSMYLQRAADSFNHLVQFHDKRPKIRSIDTSPDRKRVRTDGVEKSLGGEKGKNSENRAERSDKKADNNPDDTKPAAEDLERNAAKKEEKKKKRKKKSDEAELKEKSSRKKSRDEAVDS